MNRYGSLIRKERERKGLSLEECAGIALIPADVLKEAEAGQLELPYADLVLLGNTLEISAVALQKGSLIRQENLPDLEMLLYDLEEQLGSLRETVSYMLDVIQKFHPHERYQVRIHDDRYYIYDTEEAHYVEPPEEETPFQSAVKAWECVTALNTKGRKLEHPVEDLMDWEVTFSDSRKTNLNDFGREFDREPEMVP